MKKLTKTIKKNLFTLLGKVPVSVVVIAIAVFDGLGAAYLVNSSSTSSKFALLRYYFPGTKMVWLFAGVACSAIIMQLLSMAIERLLGKPSNRCNGYREAK